MNPGPEQTPSTVSRRDFLAAAAAEQQVGAAVEQVGGEAVA